MTTTFDFSQNIILEDDFVLLRPLQESDVENLLEISNQEPETWEYSLIRANGKENWQNYIQLALKARANKTEFPFIVFDKKSGKYAGSTRFYDINFPFKTLQLGFTWYGKDFRADNNNHRSIAAMKSIGCKVEGILRNHRTTFESDLCRDTIVLSILRKEWFEEVKENLRGKL